MIEQAVERAFFNWLRGELKSGLPDDVLAVNFNISEDSSGFVVSMIAANEYDPDDGGWACDAVVFETTQPFRGLTVEVVGTTEWRQGQARCAELVGAYIASGEGDLLRRFPVTVGFVDGSLELVSGGPTS